MRHCVSKAQGTKGQECNNMTAEKKKILIVDDHPLVRKGLEQIINTQEDLAVCGEAGTLLEALEAVETLRPDLAIVDLSLGDSSGIDLIGALQERRRGVQVLVLSMHDEAFYAERALRAGARGYIMKGGSLSEVVEAVRKVMKGEVYLSSHMTARVAERLVGGEWNAFQSPLDSLSDREKEVFALIGEGMGPSEIARKLHLSVKTIETYRAQIREKLSLADAAALRRYAIHWKMNTI